MQKKVHEGLLSAFRINPITKNVGFNTFAIGLILSCTQQLSYCLLMVVNGVTSLACERGVGQCDSLSPLLFCIGIWWCLRIVSMLMT
jgi:hypothetical protein